ncbi:MAG TPA: tetratricopeptide repeat protein [Terriglobia bacterium]|nr:tetratricopeptide repeat protein [Terriglobia bacterium]
MRSFPRLLGLRALAATLALISMPEALFAIGQHRSQVVEAAQARIEGFVAACTVELDASPAGKTDSQGTATLTTIEPGDHYVHIACPGQEEQAFFISPKPGEHLELRPKSATAAPSPLDAAAAHRELQGLVQKAVQERTAGQSDQAIADLRHAAEMDPENPDLHRELGITFLLMKDWERARVEYMEAIKHDPSEAESHNGLGYALDKMGEIEAAVNEFRTATRLDPDDDSYRQHYIETLAEIEVLKERGKKKKQ